MRKKLIIKPSNMLLILIIVTYSVISFYKLGSTKNPQTFINLKDKHQLTYKIETDQIPYKAMIYSGNNETYISVFFTNTYKDFDTYQYDNKPIEIKYNNIFKWNEHYFNNTNYYKYIMFQSYYDTTTIGEICLYDKQGNKIPLTAMENDGKILIDEQSTIPKEMNYMNSTYFDEVYFPRTAYEQLHNMSIYEYTHPPLGKLLISIPMYFLGVTPFAYRVGGNIAGILMILVIYLISKELFKKERYALFSAIIIALDGMHFVQTRIGTADSYLVLFCLTSFLFFLKYIKIPNTEKLDKKMMPLMLSGIFWGMAISTKWTAAYVGLGMGIIYLIKYIIGRKLDLKLLAWSVLSFIIVPISIYVLTYIPIILNPNHEVTYTHQYSDEKDKLNYFDKTSISSQTTEDGITTVTYKVKITNIKTFIEYQKVMYSYHSNLKDSHTYSSKWYQWPIIERPLWYYIGRFDNDKIGTIACMGNPAIWYIGIITTILTALHGIIKKNKESLIITAMILATWLPYAFIRKNNVHISLFYNNPICNVNHSKYNK